MNANDILKQKIRQLKAEGAFFSPPSGLEIASANRETLEKWLQSLGINAETVISDFHAGKKDIEPIPEEEPMQATPPPMQATPPPIQSTPPPMQATPPPMQATPPPIQSGLGGLIDSAIQSAVATAMQANGGGLSQADIDRIQATVIDYAQAAILEKYGANGGKATRIEIVQRDGTPTKDMGVQHAAFPLVLAAIQAGVNIALVGPAGTGKTTMAEKIADSLGRSFTPFSCGPDTLRSSLIGRPTVNGDFILGALPLSMQAGGIILLDEADKLNGALAPMLNSALANRYIGLDTGETIRALASWQPIMAMNTFGTGATDLYQSARQDAATMDRMFFIQIDYDNALEASFLGIDTPQQSPDYSLAKGGQLGTKEAWLAYVQAVRVAIDANGIRHVVSPRATLMGLALAGQGIGIHWLLEGLIFKGLKPEQRKKIQDTTTTEQRNLKNR